MVNKIQFDGINDDTLSLIQKPNAENLQKIAAQKAGAIHNSKQLLVSCQQRPIVHAILSREAKNNNNIIHYQQSKSSAFTSLVGSHQRTNARLAALTLQLFAPLYQLCFKNIIKHIVETHWPGRIQTLQQSFR